MDDRIIALKDKYAGNWIWMVGSGPSLDWTDLNLIAGRHSFGINAIGGIYEKYTWRPSFFWLSTGQIMDDPYWERVKLTLDLGLPTFINNRMMTMHDWVPWNDQIIWLEALHCTAEKPEPQDEWWNPDTLPHGYVSNFGTSMFGASQIAAYMGFVGMIFVGCDMGYKGWEPGTKDVNHFGDDYESGKFEQPDVFHLQENPRRIKSHEIMQRQARARGIQMYNATIGGELRVYSRINYHSAAKGKIRYVS